MEDIKLQLLKLDLMTKAAKIALWDLEVVKGASEYRFTWTQEFRKMLGFDDINDFPDQVTSWSDRLHPNDKEATLAQLTAHLNDHSGQTPYNPEYQLKMKNGEYRHFQAFGETLRDKDGTPLRAAGALVDITERKMMEQAIVTALKDAEAASKAKSNFLSTMSHEIRTPLSAIIGMTAIGKKGSKTEDKDRALNKIGDASSHLLGIINDILDMAKIEADKLELSPVEYDFEKMINKVVAIINFRVDEKVQTLDIEIDEKIPPFIIGDEQRLAQIITNLLSNAVKFTPEGGKIRLEALLLNETAENCELRITVSDNGIGFSNQQHEKMFQPFEQLDSGISREYGGTGLGLVISKRIIELMGGNISVESAPGKGAKFIFTVKARRSPKTRVEQANALEAKGQAESSDNSGEFAGKKLLFAEDIEINREMLITLLEDTGLLIDCAENGQEALDLITMNPGKYDIVFMDIQMPKMDGHEATRRIRALPDTAALPIIALTANVFKSDIETCLEAGMNDHLGKPFDIGKVLEILRKYVTAKALA